MTNKNEEILTDLFLSSDEAQELLYDPEIKEALKKGNVLLAHYRKKARLEKAASFKKNLVKPNIAISISIEKAQSLFDKLMNGGFGQDLKNRGLGYCRNDLKKELTTDEKIAILKTLDLIDKDHE